MTDELILKPAPHEGSFWLPWDFLRRQIRSWTNDGQIVKERRQKKIQTKKFKSLINAVNKRKIFDFFLIYSNFRLV